ncbi:MAG: HlyD family secretion protein [Sedimenticolaceae bacterium]
MSEQEQAAVEEEDRPEAETSAAGSVRKGVLLILAVILLSLAWYLVSDRYTPYTRQARVQGFVVGVAPKVGGLVTRVWVKNNQEVDAGDPLFEIDPSQYEIALQRAESDLQNTRSQVDAGGAGVESAQANLRKAMANEVKARQDAERQQRLYREDPGTISVRRLEISQATLEAARASVDAAKAEVQRAVDQVGGTIDNNAQLKTALTAVEKAALDLSNTVVRASSRGVITDLRADVGQYANAGAAVMTLIAIQDVWIDAEFTENNLGHLRIGSPVEMALDALPGQIFGGKIRSIGLGVSGGQAQAAGTLPTIKNNRDWLRQSQRFPVVIGFDPGQQEQLRDYVRIGGQVDVIAFSEGHPLLLMLGKAYIRIMSWLSYAY